MLRSSFALIATFTSHQSQSVQQTLYAMGAAALAACEELQDIHFLLSQAVPARAAQRYNPRSTAACWRPRRTSCCSAGARHSLRRDWHPNCRS